MSGKFSSCAEWRQLKEEVQTTSQGHCRKVSRGGSRKHLSKLLATSCYKANGHANANALTLCIVTSVALLECCTVYNLNSFLKVLGSEPWPISSVSAAIKSRKQLMQKPPFKKKQQRKASRRNTGSATASLADASEINLDSGVAAWGVYTEKAPSSRGKEAENRFLTKFQPNSCTQSDGVPSHQASHEPRDAVNDMSNWSVVNVRSIGLLKAF